MMSPRDRFVNCITGKPVDRPPFLMMWAPWASTWARWNRENKPSELDSWQKVRWHFSAEAPPYAVPVNCGPCPAFDSKTIEETAEHRVFVDSWGILRKDLKDNESMSQFLSFPVKNADDWMKYKKERLDPKHPGRLAGPWKEKCLELHRRGVPLQLGYFPDVGIFGGLRWLLGDEECLVAFCLDPELVHDIMNHLTDLYLTVFEQVVRAVPIDAIHIWEDMAGKAGPLIGPDMWDEFMYPCYKRISDFAAQHNIPVISVDTDGQPDLIMPNMIRGGMNLLFPLEVAAGCDINAMQKKYPHLGMLGGIDKRVLARDKKAIDDELARIAPAITAGRYIPELDHLIPDDVSWDNFCYYVQGLKEVLHVH